MPRRILFILLAILLATFVLPPSYQQRMHAAEIKANDTCARYTILRGSVLSTTRTTGHIGVQMVARVDGIATRNVLFAVHSRGFSQPTEGAVEQKAGKYASSIIARGYVRWYAYDVLERSTYQQVDTLLRHAASHYGLPVKLILAIARQESGLRQHVIARDGGIGVMQIMPYTAMSINKMTGTVRDPYKVQDNIFMGAFYLHTLGDSLHWNMPRVISAYNEGPWAVTHQGIFNWHYVNNVMAMLR